MVRLDVSKSVYPNMPTSYISVGNATFNLLIEPSDERKLHGVVQSTNTVPYHTPIHNVSYCTVHFDLRIICTVRKWLCRLSNSI